MFFRYLDFYPDLFGHVLIFCHKSDLMGRLRLVSKFMMSQPGKQTITMHILPNTSRNKEIWTIEFARLVDYHTGNNFLQKSCRKCGRRTISRRLFVF